MILTHFPDYYFKDITHIRYNSESELLIHSIIIISIFRYQYHHGEPFPQQLLPPSQGGYYLPRPCWTRVLCRRVLEPAARIGGRLRQHGESGDAY